ncbi:hypothetical protein SAMN04488030_3359 [Aliiroseovarius halocynthiae]|uniref:Lipoprotein n=1 Tax=Aliiroseovarius halocynthiae TaxID=985055 RepID=A0A545SLS0_9RHOB|nr:hypothetical protein [Aliiroseovarius halocynthiae]TQV65927.1 hypothetical protein FIL88_15690 [Aliiroseovarius halocynthiae]SMR83440.1 hypothetical protein SAMN04488030_3359 [Aliiroseovarius halocynthiae]
MKQKIFTAVVFGSFLTVASCNSTEQANNVLAQKYQGSQVDAFFLQHGPPVRSFRTKAGETIYIWAEEPKNYYVPPTANTTLNNYGATSYATTNFYGGGSYNVQCQLKVIADRRGVIKQIAAHKDTVGDWDLSRCHEVFGKSKK